MVEVCSELFENCSFLEDF